jgi:hypothetical protein
VDLALERRDLLLEARADLPELGDVEGHAGPLHGHEHLDERQLDLGEEALEAALGQLGPLALGQGAGGDRPLGERVPVIGPDADPLLGGELLERVDATGGVEQVGRDHGVVLEHDR